LGVILEHTKSTKTKTTEFHSNKIKSVKIAKYIIGLKELRNITKIFMDAAI
jgi:hypothetical protein